MPLARLVHHTASRSQTALLFLLPHGGQNLARRNAWAAMSVDAGHARARRDADAAFSHAVAPHPVVLYPVAPHADDLGAMAASG